MNNYIALALTFAIAFGFLRLMGFFAHCGWIESKLSRKLIHIGAGPILSCDGSFLTTLPLCAGWRRWFRLRARFNLR